MTKRAIFWIDSFTLPYCISYYFQKKFDGELFAVIDITNKVKNFYQTQKLVNFKKVWFYNDSINMNDNPNIEYLQNFEKKYDIDLWNLALNERLLYLHNEYHNFSAIEIEKILTNECQFFEKILDEINPDYLITKETALHHNQLFYLMCKKRGVKILMLNNTKLGSKKYIISENIYQIDSDVAELDVSVDGTFNDLQKLLKLGDSSGSLKKYARKRAASKFQKINALCNYLFNSKNDNVNTHYSYFGRTKFRVITKEFFNVFKRKSRKSFLDQNSQYSVDFNEKFVLLPLHQEPERSLLIASPYFTNQLETIRHVAKSLPPGFRLYVKEHYSQSLREWRKIQYYKEILEIPNVKLIHPSFSMEDLIKNSSLVIAVSGTASFEAAFYEKPSIIFANMGFSKLSSVFLLRSIDELPNLIRKAISTKVDLKQLNAYVHQIENQSFDFDLISYSLEEANYFRYGGNNSDKEITSDQMLSFLNNFEEILNNLTNEFLKKL